MPPLNAELRPRIAPPRQRPAAAQLAVALVVALGASMAYAGLPGVAASASVPPLMMAIYLVGINIAMAAGYQVYRRPTHLLRAGGIAFVIALLGYTATAAIGL